MNGHPMADWRRASLQYGCTACGAVPGQWCISTGNKPAHLPHVQRTRLASADHWQIFEEGGTDDEED